MLIRPETDAGVPPRVASRNFVTGCLIKDVTRRLTNEALNGLSPPPSWIVDIVAAHAVTGNISGEATNLLSNIFLEATRGRSVTERDLEPAL